MNDKNWQTVRELEHGYKRLGLEVIENFLLSIASGRAGDGKGAGLMFAAVVDKLHPLMDAREAYLNAREEVANYAEDLGALSGDQAEIEVLRRKNKALEAMAISAAKVHEADDAHMRVQSARIKDMEAQIAELEMIIKVNDYAGDEATPMEEDFPKLKKPPVLKLFKVWPAWEAEPEIREIEATDRREAAVEMVSLGEPPVESGGLVWKANRQFMQCGVRDILRVEVCAGEYSREYCVEEVK